MLLTHNTHTHTHTLTHSHTHKTNNITTFTYTISYYTQMLTNMHPHMDAQTHLSKPAVQPCMLTNTHPQMLLPKGHYTQTCRHEYSVYTHTHTHTHLTADFFGEYNAKEC